MSEPRSGTPVTVGDLEIEPIERSVVRVENVCGVIVVVAVKEPVAVVLRSPRGTWRVDVATLESCLSCDGARDRPEGGPSRT